jgi:hypothetical protein
MPCVISWGYDRGMFFGAGAWSARYIHGGFALARANGRTTLNDHRGGTRDDLRVIFVFCDGRVHENPSAKCATMREGWKGKRDLVGDVARILVRTLVRGIVDEEVESRWLFRGCSRG